MMQQRTERWKWLAVLFTIPIWGIGKPVRAAVPAGFTESVFASGLSSPTAMTFAPDGRLFVCEQRGVVRVIRNGAMLPDPFLQLQVSSTGERGLLGIAFDPAFPSEPYVYIYYTTSTAPIHNRVSRFTVSGDTAVADSEQVILDLENLTAATNHNGGAIHFGKDGMLYVAVGDNATSSNAQTLANRLGKMLRIRRDGTIPEDNPFYTTASGQNRAIWALGLRNPYTFAVQPETGRIFINDVGQSTWEEINDGVSGANYGWPVVEGPSSNPAYTPPLHAYGHGSSATTGCAISGGAFYNPAFLTFPVQYHGAYFFADYCSSWIRRYDPATNTATAFASGYPFGMVDLKIGQDGNLYYLTRGGGGIVGRISYPAGAYTVDDARKALQAAAGLISTETADLPRLDVARAAESAGVVDLADVLMMVRALQPD